MELYDRIGENYDSTRHADEYILNALYGYLNLSIDDSCLDIGCGTGNYTVGLSMKGLRMTGLDPSQKMLERARSKNSNIQWIKGFAEKIPFSDEMFQGCICILTIHHFNDLALAFKEMYRVMHKGRIVIFTCAHEQIKGYWLTHYFPEAMNKICEYMPNVDRVESELTKAGFELYKREAYFVQEDLQDNFLYSKKHIPQMYLDKNFRNGMSVFSSKANHVEVEKGCEILRRDIDTSKVFDIISQYSNDIGDYTFVIAEKK